MATVTTDSADAGKAAALAAKAARATSAPRMLLLNIRVLSAIGTPPMGRRRTSAKAVPTPWRQQRAAKASRGRGVKSLMSILIFCPRAVPPGATPASAANSTEKRGGMGCAKMRQHGQLLHIQYSCLKAIACYAFETTWLLRRTILPGGRAGARIQLTPGLADTWRGAERPRREANR